MNATESLSPSIYWDAPRTSLFKEQTIHYCIKLILLFSDIVSLIGCLYIAYYMRYSEKPSPFISTPSFLMMFVTVLGCFYIFDLYNLDSQISGLRAPLRFIIASIINLALLSTVGYLGAKHSGLTGRGILIGALTLYAVWGSILRFYLEKWTKIRKEKLKWLVIVSNEKMPSFHRDLSIKKQSDSFYFLVDSLTPQIPAVLGTWDKLKAYWAIHWSGIIVESSKTLPDFLIESLIQLRLRGTRIYDLSEFYEHTWFKVPVYAIQQYWIALSHGFDLIHSPFGLRIKRLFDLILATLMLIAGLPIVGLASFLILLQADGGPVLYRQWRIGKDGKKFKIYKLRTMKPDAETNGAVWTEKKDPRITLIGKLLRLTRIDELPQLWNVLRGEMSFIGPRPERPEFIALLEEKIPHYQLRHLIRPGITGWAQVMYSYGSSIEDAKEKLQYDLYYIKNFSFFLDIAIIFKTVRIILFGKGR